MQKVYIKYGVLPGNGVANQIEASMETEVFLNRAQIAEFMRSQSALVQGLLDRQVCAEVEASEVEAATTTTSYVI